MLVLIWKLFCLAVVTFPLGLSGVFFYLLPRRQRRRAQLKLLSLWAKLMCSLFRLNIQLRGEPLPSDFGRVVISNHTSYLDIIALASVMPLTFISKSSVKWWPILGQGAVLAGVLFVDRSKIRSGSDVLAKAVDILKDGANLCIFPEGTTGDGEDILKFRTGAFRLAARADVPVLPVVLVYRDMDKAKWVGDMTFLGHLKSICRSKLDLVIHICPQMCASDFDGAVSFAEAAKDNMSKVYRDLRAEFAEEKVMFLKQYGSNGIRNPKS